MAADETCPDCAAPMVVTPQAAWCEVCGRGEPTPISFEELNEFWRADWVWFDEDLAFCDRCKDTKNIHTPKHISELTKELNGFIDEHRLCAAPTPNIPRQTDRWEREQ